MTKSNLMSDLDDDFSLSPSLGFKSKTEDGIEIPEGPEIVKVENQVEEPIVNKVETKKEEKNGKVKNSSKEGSSEETSSEEDEAEDSEEKIEPKTEGAEDINLVPFAKEIFEKIELPGEFNEAEFIETFGGKDLDSVLKFVKTVIDENSKVVHPNEEAERYYNYVASGGDPNKLSYLLEQEATFESIKEEDLEENEELQRNILRTLYKKTNPKKDEKWISAKIQRAVDAGIAKEEAIDGLQDLNNLSKEEKEAEIKAQEQAVKEQKKAQEEYWTNIRNDIDTLDSSGIKLTKDGKEKFYNYLKSGKYQQDLKKSRKTELELAYILYEGGVNKAVTKLGKTQAVSQLEATLSRHTSTGSKVKSQITPHTTSSEEKNKADLSIWSL